MRRLSHIAGSLLLLIGAAFAWTSAAAEPTAATSTAAPSRVLRADFTQERWIDGFRHPLRSEGAVLLVRGEGLRWETRVPFPSVMILRGDEIRLRDREGRERPIGEGAGAQLPALLQSLMEALLSGDRVTLAQRFTVREAPAPSADEWMLELRPHDAMLSALYVRIDVRGGEHVDALVLHERGGGRTTIRFSNTTVAANVGEQERRALD